MKFCLTTLAALFATLCIPCASAQDVLEKNHPVPSLTGSFTTAINTAYMGKIGTVFYREPTTVNYLDLNLGKDWTLEFWSSTGLGKERWGTTFGDEFDIFFTWHHQFNDVRVSLTGAYFFIEDLGHTKDDIWIGEGEVSYTKYPWLQPYISARYFGQVTTSSPESGWFYWLGVRGTYPTPIKQAKLTVELSAAYSDGAFGHTPGLVFGRAVIGLPVSLSKRVTLTPSVLLQTPIGDQRDHAVRFTDRNEAVGSLALRIDF